MARLYRFVKLNDRLDTQILTFLLPPTLINDSPKEIESKDFMYGNQKWSIFIAKHDGQIGVYLSIRGAVEGLTTTVDFSFTFTNKEHFTKNDTYAERSCVFTHAKHRHGRKNFVSMAELLNRNFAMDNGQYLLSLEMRNGTNIFEQTVQLPNENSKSTQIGGANRYQKLETTYFPCGNFVWNLAVFPFGDTPEKDGIPMLYLVRQTNFDHHCRVRYNIRIGQGDKVLDTDAIEQVFDTSGSGKPYEIRSSFRHTLYALASGKKLSLRIELLGATAISECHLFPRNREKNNANLYDREKQAWMIESDTSLESLRFRLFYTDVRNVSRRHIRHMGFGLSVVPRRGHYKPIKAVGVPYSQLYPSCDGDVEGYDIKTDIAVKEINNPGSAILDEEGRLTVHVEWVDSLMMFNEQYNKTDEIDSRHKHQMAREIMALQAENFSLEKQLHSYQISISKPVGQDGLHVPLDPILPVIKNGSTKDPRPNSGAKIRSSTPDSRKAASKRDRSRDKRRGNIPAAAEIVPGAERYNDVHGQTNNHAANGRGHYEYPDGYSDRGEREKRHDTYPNDVTAYPSDGYAPDTYTKDEYRGGEYGDDYQYYSDKYSKNEYTTPAQDKFYNTPYSDPYAPSDQVNGKISPEKYPYGSQDQYGQTSPEKHADGYSQKYSDTYGSGTYPNDPQSNYAVDTYPEDISFNRDRYTRKGSDGSRVGKARDQQSDDGYYSSSTQHHIDANNLNTAQGLSAQYLEKYPEERISGRRSPSHHRRPSTRKSSTGSDVTKSPEIGRQSACVSRSKPRQDKYK